MQARSNDNPEVLIEWLRHAELPDRFQLNPWTYCTDGRKLKAMLLSALETTPSGETAQLAIAQLLALRVRFGRLYDGL